MTDDWSRWLDEAPEGEPSGEVARDPAPVVRLRRKSGERAEDRRRPILVVGGCGGAGTTTTALGLAGELVTEGATVAVDATAAGSDLALRGADKHLHPVNLQSWVYGRGDDEPAPLEDCLSRSTSGFGLLWRDATPLRRRATYLTVARALDSGGYTAVYDGGNPIAGRQLRPLLDDADIALVLAIPARVDAANRLRVTLEWLDDHYGDDGAGVVADTTIVVSHQYSHDDSRVAEHLREHLSGWVREVVEIPYDPHLARGELVRHSELAEPTRAAYGRLLAGVAS
ncbi:MinD/ParA family protein [Nocardia rhizosphaerihabitans]|uniref:MinD/ParA family ATP-binding protein n=1 Tax=Nocardia rhizosphaerihabitans TaxID=1691570 RepID=UPI00366F1989